MASSSSCNNWLYDVFPSFSGEDVRVTFLSHFLKELDRKLIIAFKDSEIEKSKSLDPVLRQAIRNSRIAVVILSEKYASSTWCLDELVEIFKCSDEFGQIVIPVFYGLEPSNVRKQTGKFGEFFAETCLRKTEDEILLWRQSLTRVANLLGFHSQKNWPNEAKMIEAIASDVLVKLDVSLSTDFEEFVGLEDHIAKMSVLLELESQEVRMVGIWGSSGIGKTSIARALFSQLSRHFQGSVFIDRAFVSKSMQLYKSANPDDYNMKLHLLRSFLSEVLEKEDIKIHSLGAVKERLKHRKVLIVVDDLEDQMVLDTLVGQTQWFGTGSRIIVITKDKQFLRAHGIDHIYEVCLPSEKLALEMFCRFCFRQNFPPDGLKEFASEVAFYAGNLPLGLKVLGSNLRGRDKEDLIEMLPRLRSDLDRNIEKTLRVSYKRLNYKKDQTIFRHIACLFNGGTVNEIKQLLADSELEVNIGLKNLVDKSLIHVRDDTVEMPYLIQEMGKDIVRAQSTDPGEREFLIDSKDIRDVLQYNTGTNKVLGIDLNMDEIDELNIHEKAFEGMRNVLFLKINNKKWYEKWITTRKWYDEKEVRWNLQDGFDYLPQKLRLLRFDGYPLRSLPSNFRPANLVKLQMQGSNLERLWEGVHTLRGLKEIDLKESKHLKEIPDLSTATNLERLDLSECSSLVELPTSIKSLNKLEKLIMSGCRSLETLPNGINLQSLSMLDLERCSKLNIFPNISTNISELFLSETCIDELPSDLRLKNLLVLKMENENFGNGLQPFSPFMSTLPHLLGRLLLSNIPSLVELPYSINNFTNLNYLSITDCINLVTIPTGINLEYLINLDLKGCSSLKNFPNISTNLDWISLAKTGIEEVPWWIENFSKLRYLNMSGCNSLKSVSLHISKLKKLGVVDFTECRALNEASWNDSSSDVAMETDNIHSRSPVLDESFSSFPENFINCFNYIRYEHERQPAGSLYYMRFTGEEVLPYFNHHTTGTSLTNIPLFHSTPSPPFFKFKACAVVECKSPDIGDIPYDIKVFCQFKDRLGNHFESHSLTRDFVKNEPGIHLIIFGCSFPLNEDNASPADQVDIEFVLSYLDFLDSTAELKEWGIRLSDEFSSQENQLGNGITIRDVYEASEDNMVSETEHIIESGDSKEDNERDITMDQQQVFELEGEEQPVAKELGSRSIGGPDSVDCLGFLQGISHLLRRVFGHSSMEEKNMAPSLH